MKIIVFRWCSGWKRFWWGAIRFYWIKFLAIHITFRMVVPWCACVLQHYIYLRYAIYIQIHICIFYIVYRYMFCNMNFVRQWLLKWNGNVCITLVAIGAVFQVLASGATNEKRRAHKNYKLAIKRRHLLLWRCILESCYYRLFSTEIEFSRS